MKSVWYRLLLVKIGNRRLRIFTFNINCCTMRLHGLQKIKSLLVLNQSDAEHNQLNMQAIPILKDPHILAAAVEENRRILTPLWLELLEEGKNDGSIKTEYAKELSELLPLINFWLMPTVEEMSHDIKIIHKEFCASYFRTVDIVVWKFHLEAGIVHVCTGSNRFSRYICGDIIYCHNPDYCSFAIRRYSCGQGRQA